MARVILLDAGLVGLACSSPKTSQAQAFNVWLTALPLPDTNMLIADVTRFEVRRELIRIKAQVKLERLDRLCFKLGTFPVTTEAWERAADFWAIVRQAGHPTASPDALDADAILAAVAATISRPGDQVVIATTNIRHLSWFPGIDARRWVDIL